MRSATATKQPAATTNPPITAALSAGDLVIGFNAQPDGPGRMSSASWTNSASGSEWNLWEQPPSPGWKGFPLAHLTAPGWQIWLLGELYGGNDGAIATEQFLLEIVRGERAAAELNGHLLMWAWDESRRQWHVWTDRFGTLHAYHGRRGNRAAIGTCFKTVASLASGRQLDWEALTSFFGFGFFPQDRTFFQDVRVLRPATHSVFDVAGKELSSERYWNWGHEPDGTRSYDDTVSAFREVFEQVMGEQLQGDRIAVPISGGLDSRSTVAAIAKGTGEGLWSYSYGYAGDSIETRISREVADARALPFTAFTIKPYLFDRLDNVLASVEGFQDVTQSRQAFVAGELGTHADRVIAAHWGDVWLGDMGLVGQAPAESKGAALDDAEIAAHTSKKMGKKGCAWLLKNLCAPHLGHAEPASVLDRFVTDGLVPLRNIEDPDFRVKAYKTDNWSFRWTLASIRMFQGAAFPRLPFYDIRMADFFRTVPSAFVRERQLQIDYLKRFAPDLAAVKWQPYDANLFHFRQSELLQFPKRAVKKTWRLLTNNSIIERNWEVQFGGQAGQAGLQHWLLRPGLRLHELVSAPKVGKLLAGFQADPLKDGRGYTVSMLLTFSAWLERHTA